MPHEIRRIVFTNAETAKALNAYNAGRNLKLPKGRIIKTKIASENDSYDPGPERIPVTMQEKYHIRKNKKSVTITFFNEDTFEHLDYHLRADVITAMLIDFCLAEGIIIPSAGEKDLGTTELNIALDIMLDSATKESSAALKLDDS